MTPDGPELIGVGMGPGDPELVTVRAVRVLREADLVLVPTQDGPGQQDGPGKAAAGDGTVPGLGRAQATVLEHLRTDEQRAKVRPVAFAMDERAGLTERRIQAWQAAADRVVEAFAQGARTVAFATIGDPNVYSTFSYIAATVRQARSDVVVSTVPGITAMQDLASRSGTSLCEGTESLALVPLTAGPETYRTLLREADTVVAYKGGRQLAAALDVLAEEGRLDQTVVGSALGLADESLHSAADLRGTGTAPYLTTMITPAQRVVRGGRL